MMRSLGNPAGLLALFIGTLASAAEPKLEKIDLFEAGKDEYALYRIPGLIVTAKGTVLAYCEARRTGKSDWDTIDILLRRSTDGGRTWSVPRKISDVPGPKSKNPVALAQRLAKPDDETYNNAVTVADRDGTVHLLFCLEYCRCFYIRSEDDGVAWSTPVEITAAFEAFRSRYDWKVLATGPAHGIQLQRGPKAGRLVVPVWLSTGTGGHAHRPSVTATIYSDDGGRTWRAGDVAVPNTAEWINPNETVVVELADGRVMLNVRSESTAHRRLVVVGPDGATGWSTPRFDASLVEPICMGSIVRYSTAADGGRNRLVFANPHHLDRADGKAQPGASRDRRNLSIKLSDDEGETWKIDKVLEAGYSAYSDLAVTPDGTILCLYERGRESDGAKKKPTSYAYLTLARFNLAWLTGGQDSAGDAGRAVDDACNEPEADRDAPPAIGAGRDVGCLANPREVERLEIIKPGTYENFLVDSRWAGGNRVKITADDVVLRHCEIRNATGNGIGVFGKNVLIENCRIHHLLNGTFAEQTDAHGITGHPRKLVVRNCLIEYVSGDCMQFDPDRNPWDEVLVENCTLRTGPLAADAAGFKAGERPGENGFDSKTPSQGPRPNITFRRCVFEGWQQPGQISNLAALNLKENVHAVVEDCVFRHHENCFRVRGPGARGGALVEIRRCALFDSTVGVRMEDKLENLAIDGLAIGPGVRTPIHQDGRGPWPGFRNENSRPAPEFETLLRSGFEP